MAEFPSPMLILAKLPATTAEPPSLLTIPAELQCLIAEAADNATVITLRQTCRIFAAACLETFCTRFAKHRVHLYTRAGLQQLVDITSQPHFRAKLESIQLIAVEFVQREDPGFREFKRQHPLPEFERQNVKFTDWHVDDFEEIWDREQSSFVSSGTEAALLAQLLENLAACEKRPAIILSDQSKSHCKVREVAGYSGLKALLGAAASRMRHTRSRDTLHALTIASAHSATPITNLDLTNMNGLLGSHTFDLPDDVIQKAWSSLETLRLGTYGENETLNWFLPSLSKLATLLKSATNLKHFTLDQYSPPGTGFDVISPHVLGSSLTSLELYGLEKDEGQLQGYLERQRDTLQLLKLIIVSLPSQAAWASLFSCLSKGFRLQKIDFYGLTTYDAADYDYVSYIVRTSKAHLRAESEEAVREVFVELADSFELEDCDEAWEEVVDSEPLIPLFPFMHHMLSDSESDSDDD